MDVKREISNLSVSKAREVCLVGGRTGKMLERRPGPIRFCCDNENDDDDDDGLMALQSVLHISTMNTLFTVKLSNYTANEARFHESPQMVG